MPDKVVVLLSGGMDSATVLALAKADAHEVIALTMDYGQRHRKEIAAAKRLATHFGVREHRIVSLDLTAVGKSALTSHGIPVPTQRRIEEIGTGIPLTYVPARNTVFLSYALAVAEASDAKAIYIAANSVDYSVHGASQVWAKSANWAELLTIEEFYRLPNRHYQTLVVDPATLELGWRRVRGRYRHDASSKRCFVVGLERGQEVTVTEDHSLFTINPNTAELATIRGSEIRKGVPLVVPFDLTGAGAAWDEDLPELNLDGAAPSESPSPGSSVVIHDGFVTNRLRRTRVPVKFPVSDEFLYILGLWLAEGGKERESDSDTLGFSIGSIPGAPEELGRFFQRFGVRVHKSSSNDFDYSVSSSVFARVFEQLELLGTSKRGDKAFPPFFWKLSQRQRRLIVAGLWDGDGSHAFKHTTSLCQKSHAVIRDLCQCFALDGIFPTVRDGQHGQRQLNISRSADFRRLIQNYPLRHATKRASFVEESTVMGRDGATGIWKCQGVWDAVAAEALPPGEKTRIYNRGGKYDEGYRAQRAAFQTVGGLRRLVRSKMAFLRVTHVAETHEHWMYDLSVEGAENFVANGILAHNSGYPDCRPEFYKAFQEVARLGTKRGVEGDVIEIRTPLIAMSKADIVRKGEELGVPWALTWSCYQGEEKACGVCDSCQLRLKGFREAGVKDPIPYARRPRPTNA